VATRRDTEIRVLLTGDDAGGTRALRSFAAEVQKTGAITKEQAAVIEKALADVDRKAQALNLTKLKDAVRSQAGARIDQAAGGGAVGNLVSGLGGAEAALTKIGTAGIAAGAGVAAATAGAVKYANTAIDSFAHVGQEVRKFQQTLGVSTEEASRFWYALSAAGVRPEQGLDALNQFAVNVTQNADDLAEFDVAIARNSEGMTDMAATMLNVVDRYRSMGDSAERARLLSVTFGEEGMRQLQPLLALSSTEFRKLGENVDNVFTAEQLEKLDKYTRATEEANARIKLANAEAGADLAPARTFFAEAKADVTEWAAATVNGAQAAGGAVADFGRNLREGLSFGRRGGSGGLSPEREAANEAARASEAAAASARARAAAAQEAAGTIRAASDVEISAYQAIQATAREAYQATRTAGPAREKAAENLAKVERDSARSVEAAQESARSSIESAAEQVASAKESWADAAQSVAKAEADAARSIEDAERSAAKSVEDAHERVADARENAREAAESYADAEREAAERVAEANERAAKQVVDAQERVADARERASRTLRDNSRRLVDAQQDVLDAQSDALRDDNPFEAMRRREEALQGLQRVQEDVAESNKDANRDVQEAEQDLRDATVDAEKDRADAAEAAADQIAQARGRVVDANRVVQDAERSLAETVVEANRRVADAHQAAAEQVASAQARVADATRSVAQAEANYASTVQRAEASVAQAHEASAVAVNNARAIYVAATEAAIYAEARLQQAIQRTADMRASLAFSDPLSAAYVAAGIIEVPQFATGGVYRAPSGSDSGLAMLHDGERVLTPQQQAQWGSAPVVNLTVNGNIYDGGQKLLEDIERLFKNGFG
jgi:hypothetical protein